MGASQAQAGKWFNANEQHILDWYHIARRFEAIGKGLLQAPHVCQAKQSFLPGRTNFQ